jgi:hypothetical protein
LLNETQQPEPEVEESAQGEAVAEVEKEQGEQGQEPSVEKEKAKRRLSDRNRELTYRLRQTERELAAEKLARSAAESRTAIKAEPDPDDYADRDKYTEDKEAWKKQEREKIRAEEAENIRRESAQRARQTEAEKQKEAYLSSRPDAIKEDPKFHEYEVEIDKVVEAFDAPEIQDLILAAKKQGPKIVRYLGTNPDELEEIASASPRERAFLMGKLVAKLDAKPAKTISTAPDPIRSERGSAQRPAVPSGLAFDRTKETFAQYSARKNGLR